MDLDLGPDERELLRVVRQMSDRLGTESPAAKWWQVLSDGGFTDLDVDDGDTALQAVCIAEALGEGIAPISFPSHLACRMLMRDLAAATEVQPAVDVWRAGDHGAFAFGHQTASGQGLVEVLGARPRFAILRAGDGWLVLDSDQFRENEASAWEAAPLLLSIGWDPRAGYRTEAGDRDWNQLSSLLHTAELVGVMRETIRRTIDYLRTREQFGRPIGSFQALQHRTADMVADLRACEAMIEYAAWYWGQGPGDATSAAWVSAAAALVGEASVTAMRECFQFHGGIAMTAELWFHRWFRRATRLAAHQGGPAAHLAAVGAAVKAGVTLEVPLTTTS
jgi:hypothetical protein